MDHLASTFGADQDLCDRVLSAAKQNSENLKLLVDVAHYLSRQAPASNGTSTTELLPSKKRKLDNGPSQSHDFTSAPQILQVPDVSFVVPIRKKLTLSLHGTASEPGGLSITGKDASYTIAWSEITHLFCLPVPEKATRQHNFVLLTTTTTTTTPDAQFVFTLPETPCSVPGAREGDTHVSLIGRTLNTCLAPAEKGIVLPSPDDFESAIPQSHLKGEKGYHVKAHLGAKEGYLFFLSSGILFGFRKPVLFFPLDGIGSVSYTSVLQRTFNLVIGTVGEEGETEFAMLDQADFAGIDAYIKGRGLEDGSMARERAAKKVKVNGGKDEEDGAEEGELEKAERELQDAEDEEEEDYDPSGGESEGEGEDSEGEEAGGEGEEVEEVEEGDEDGEEE